MLLIIISVTRFAVLEELLPVLSLVT